MLALMINCIIRWIYFKESFNAHFCFKGCELDGECMQVNDYKVDSEKCIKYRCVMSSAGDGFIATKIKEIRGW